MASKGEHSVQDLGVQVSVTKLCSRHAADHGDPETVDGLPTRSQRTGHADPVDAGGMLE